MLVSGSAPSRVRSCAMVAAVEGAAPFIYGMPVIGLSVAEHKYPFAFVPSHQAKACMTLPAVAVIVQGLSQFEGKAKVVPPPEYWVISSWKTWPTVALVVTRSEEHTFELQSPMYLV